MLEFNACMVNGRPLDADNVHLFVGSIKPGDKVKIDDKVVVATGKAKQ